MDADVYGPSIPRMMNLSGEPRMDASESQHLHHMAGHAACLVWESANSAAPKTSQSQKQVPTEAVRTCLIYAGGKLYPLQNFGVKCMSMGFLMKVSSILALVASPRTHSWQYHHCCETSFAGVMSALCHALFQRADVCMGSAG